MEPTEGNRRAFEDAHRRGTASPRLPDPVRHSLGAIAGKRVLHLGGPGEVTEELAVLGALVTAVEPDAATLEEARSRDTGVLWVGGTQEALPAELRRGRFDLVYAELLPAPEALAGWAEGIASALALGGDLLVFADHPVARCVDALLRWREDYFAPDVVRLGRAVTALAAAGLAPRALEEYPLPGSRRTEGRLPGRFLLHARKASG